jgi:hypothetical protein
MGRAIRYLCKGRIRGGEFNFLWVTNDRDRVVLDEAGDLVAFASELGAREAPTGIATLSDEAPTFYDFDTIHAWCLSNDEVVDCRSLLDMWNLLNDVPGMQDLFSAAEARADALYDQLFHGCNLPAVNASPHEYVASWTSAEIFDLKRLLLLGLNDFRQRYSLGDPS